MSDAWIIGIGSKAVLLVIGGSENIISYGLEGEDTGNAFKAESERIDGEVAGLKAVESGKPGNVAKGEHETEPVPDTVDGGENGGFHVKAIKHVEHLEAGDEDDGIGYIAMDFVLVSDERQVENDVAYQARAHLVEEFDVDGLTASDWDAGGNGDAGI